MEVGKSLEKCGEGVYIIPHFWDLETCQAMREQIDDMTFEEALIGSQTIATRMSRVRNNDRIIWDHAETADALWQHLQGYGLPTFFGASALGLNERLRIYRYTKGQRFDWHADGRFRRENGEQSLYTFLLYLTDDFEGGETFFRDTKIVPKEGLACVFEHKKEHKGAEVTSGAKIVLRSDVMYSPLPLR